MQNNYNALNEKLRMIGLLRKAEIRAESGFQFGQFPLVDFVIHSDNCTQKDIADALHVTPASIAVSLDRMENADIISRSKDVDNARCNRVTVTEKGRKMYDEGKLCIDRLNRRMFEGVSEGDLAVFDKVLNAILQNVAIRGGNDEFCAMQQFSERTESSK